MAFSMPGRGASAPQINVTPLIDVLLTLIIMFMLVVSMDPEYGEKAQIPEPNQKQAENQPQPRTVVIQVIWSGKDQAPTVKLNQEDVTWEELETRLARIYLRASRK
jgi:biopolymer transport protein ExbD